VNTIVHQSGFLPRDAL